MVVRQFPVVEAFLTLLLCRNNLRYIDTEGVDEVLLLGIRETEPVRHVTALHALDLLPVDHVGQPLAGETRFTDIAAPRYCVTVHDSIVDDAHHLVHRQVVRQRVTPVVLYFDGKLGVERMVRIRSNAYIIVPVQAEAGSKALRGVLLALIGEGFRALAEVSVKDALQSLLPLTGDLIGLVACNRIYVWLQKREELVEVVQRIAIKRSRKRHGTLRTDTIVFERVKNIIRRSSLCKLTVAVQTYNLYGTVHVRLVGDEALTEVIGLAGLLQNLGLEIAQRGIVPACARPVLVLDACDGNLLYNCENRFVGGCTLLLVRGICTHRHQSEQCCY